MSRVAVVGAGSWGTTLAAVLTENGHDVVLWAREPEIAEQVNREHQNRRFLNGVRLPDGLRATDRFEDAIR